MALARLAEWVLLLGRRALISLRVWLGWRHLKRAEHGDLDCLWMMNVGRALVVVLRRRRGIDVLVVVNPVELVEHVALLRGCEGILRVVLSLLWMLMVLLLLGLCRGLEVQKESGRGEHRSGRRAEHWSNVCCLQTTDALCDVELFVDDDDGKERKKSGPRNLGTPRTTRLDTRM